VETAVKTQNTESKHSIIQTLPEARLVAAKVAIFLTMVKYGDDDYLMSMYISARSGGKGQKAIAVSQKLSQLSVLQD
jgi:hypothetical protein